MADDLHQPLAAALGQRDVQVRELALDVPIVGVRFFQTAAKVCSAAYHRSEASWSMHSAVSMLMPQIREGDFHISSSDSAK
jgi:hypothetical protein